MSLLPQSKSALREYLESVNELVEKRKEKLSYFEDKEVRGILHRGHGDGVLWIVAANQEFREMEKAIGLSFHGQFGVDLWLEDELYGYTE